MKPFQNLHNEKPSFEMSHTNKEMSLMFCRSTLCRPRALFALVPQLVLTSSLAALTLMGSSTASQAQEIGTGAGQPAVVMDFEVAPGVDPILGRKAADAVAVEMEASGDFDVVPRQQMEDAVATRNGLQPPYTATTLRRLGEVMGARSVMSGRVVTAVLGRSARDPRVRETRVTLQLRQLEVRTGDFINGTQVTEVTADELNDFDDDVLMNQSLDKAAFSAVRTIRLIVFPEGRVMHTTTGSVELSLGRRNGLVPGQRFSVMRDVANKLRGPFETNVTVQRVKIAEIAITGTEDDISRARVVSGGSVGVRTNDIVRRIFAPGVPFTEPAFERSAEATGGASDRTR
ncbi:MAG TPA: hypothetical protein VF600_08070 [Abditibacteriaceae bacterium]